MKPTMMPMELPFQPAVTSVAKMADTGFVTGFGSEIPADALLAENGEPILTESGEYITLG